MNIYIYIYIYNIYIVLYSILYTNSPTDGKANVITLLGSDFTLLFCGVTRMGYYHNGLYEIHDSIYTYIGNYWVMYYWDMYSSIYKIWSRENIFGHVCIGYNWDSPFYNFGICAGFQILSCSPIDVGICWHDAPQWPNDYQCVLMLHIIIYHHIVYRI